MQTAKDVLNRIKWDKREKPEDYTLAYLDRVENKLIEIGYDEIKRIEGSFLIVERVGGEVNIPMHRIRVVKKKGVSVWQR